MRVNCRRLTSASPARARIPPPPPLELHPKYFQRNTQTPRSVPPLVTRIDQQEGERFVSLRLRKSPFRNLKVTDIGTVTLQDESAKLQELINRGNELESFGLQECIQFLDALTRTPEMISLVSKEMTSNGIVQKIVNRTMVLLKKKVTHDGSFHSEHSISDILNIMDSFSDLHIRTPLRDVSEYFVLSLKINHSNLSVTWKKDRIVFASECLSILGRGLIYQPDIYGFIISPEMIRCIPIDTLPNIIYETGRHGLRTKHFLDELVPIATSRVNDISIQGICQMFQALSKFVKEWVEFFRVVINSEKLTTHLESIPSFYMISILKVCRELRQTVEYKEFINKTFTELIRRMVSQTNSNTVISGEGILASNIVWQSKAKYESDIITNDTVTTQIQPQDLSMLVLYADHDNRFPDSVGEFSKATLDLVASWFGFSANPPKYTAKNFSATDIVDILRCWSSWGQYDERVYDVMLTELADNRLQEIKYSPNISLWQSVTLSCCHVSLYHAKWMRAVFDICRSIHMVERISFWQTINLLEALVNARLYDSVVYSNIARVIMKDVNIIQEPRQLCGVFHNLFLAGVVSDDITQNVVVHLAKLIRLSGQGLRGRQVHVPSWVDFVYALGGSPVDCSDDDVVEIFKFISRLPVPESFRLFTQFYRGVEALGTGSEEYFNRVYTDPRCTRMKNMYLAGRFAEFCSDVVKSVHDFMSRCDTPKTDEISNISLPVVSSGEFIEDTSVFADITLPQEKIAIFISSPDHPMGLREMRMVPALDDRLHVSGKIETHLMTGPILVYKKILSRVGWKCGVLSESVWRLNNCEQKDDALKKIISQH